MILNVLCGENLFQYIFSLSFLYDSFGFVFEVVGLMSEPDFDIMKEKSFDPDLSIGFFLKSNIASKNIEALWIGWKAKGVYGSLFYAPSIFNPFLGRGQNEACSPHCACLLLEYY